MPDDPWYKDGLKFKCRGCGHCCRGPGGYVWVSDEEAEALAKALSLSLKDFAKKYLRATFRGNALVDGPTGDCVLLTPDGHCMAYDARPIQCRTYPWWPEVIRDEKSWEREKMHCPGIGEDELHTAEEIRSVLKTPGNE